MNILIILCLIFLGVYSCVSWVVPILLAWLFKRKYHIKLKIGRIAVPKLIFKDVHLSKDGYSIEIDEISFRSSFFNSEINKLLSVIIRNVKIHNNVEEKRSVVVETILKPLLSKQNSSTRSDEQDQSASNRNLTKDLNALLKRKLLDFRDKKMPQSLIVFAQFMGIHITNASVMFYKNTTIPWVLELSALEIHADGTAGGPAKALVFSANILDSSVRIMLLNTKERIAELSFSLLVEGTVKVDGPLNVEKMHVAISNLNARLQGNLYNFIKYNKSVSKSGNIPMYEDEIQTLVPRLSPIIPKIFSLSIDKTRVNCTFKSINKQFIYSLQKLQINSRFSAGNIITDDRVDSVVWPQLYVAFQTEELKLSTAEESIAFVNKLKFDAKLEKGVLNVYIIISVLNIFYNHSDVYLWFTCLEQIQKAQAMPVTNLDKKSPSPYIQYMFNQCVVQGCVEFRAVTIRTRLSQADALTLGCGSLKIKLDQLFDTREESYTSKLAHLVVGNRHWSTEVLVDGGWAITHDKELNDTGHKRQHAWGTTLLLGVALVKWGTHGSRDSKIEAMMDCLRFEWSQRVSNTINAAIDCLLQYRKPSTKTTKPIPEKPPHVTVDIALSHINMFFIIKESICLMARVDAISLDRGVNKSWAVVKGMKFVDMVPYKGTVTCQRSEEIRRAFFHASLFRIEQVPRTKDNSILLDVQLTESVDLQWSANIHMKFITLIHEIRNLKANIKFKLNGDGDMVNKGETRKKDWRVAFKSDTRLGFELSKSNKMLLYTDDTSIGYSHKSGLTIVWGQIKLVLNGDEVVVVDGFTMERVKDNHDIRVERKANEGFQLAWNRVWGVNIELIRVVFPYKHRFADAIQGDFVTLFKWIKAIHGIKKKAFTSESPLPSDLYIKIEEFLIEMTDDPFEVKLRDNYELLEDEYKESEKRRTMLDAKVQELCKPHLFLPAGKVEELYSALHAKDAQIYVHRCRAAPPPRTRLVACALTHVSIMALADPSMHGTTRATSKMRDIDYDSPWPEEGLEWTTLWCRGVKFQSTSCALLLRDFPQPLLSLQQLRMWGTLLGAEEAAPTRALRTVVIDQGAPWGPHNLERSMMPLKFYYDLCCEMDQFSYAFGPCWEPVIAQCNLAFDQVSRPSLDPSNPLAWWDKIRLLMHGRLTANFKRCTCLLHVSLDPYNTTEEMELTWSDLVLDWTNGKIGFLGELNVYVRTASKYDDCRVLHVPCLRLGVKLGWHSVTEPRDHHSVAPCAPDRLPEYSSHQEHDSYRAFRSSGLDLHICLETKASDTVGSVLLLYGSTLRWFESLKLILSGITRPTRRGLVFDNVRPRKPQLSRHYKAVSISLTLHNMQVFYWSSSSMQRGIEILGLRVTCGSKHSLSLVPTNDGLIRRPRANWTTIYMNCDLNDVEIWLKSALAISEESKEKDNVSGSTGMNSPIEKCYCLSVRRVSYGREATGGVGALGGVPTHRLAVHDLRGAWTKLNRDVAFALLDTYIKTQQLKKNLSTKALKEEEKPTTSPKHQRETDMVSPPPTATGLQPAGGGLVLSRLVAEAGTEVVLPEELTSETHSAPHTAHAPQLDDDNAHTACLIELVNSQVLLKGCETRGYVILCAARAEVRQRVRKTPASTAWAGSLSAMQYYATVSDTDHLNENIQWVSVEEISERWTGGDINTLPDVPRLVGSGHSAGGVIGSTVGPSSDTDLTQLQRIVSRCACEFYYVSHDEAEESASGEGTGQWAPAQRPYDSFTLMHHDLDVCTNSLQYAMLLDVVNNVVLHVEPERRRTLERRARMRFQLQLHQDQDPRGLIHKLQTQVRESLIRLRRLEKEYYLRRRALAEADAADTDDKTLDAQVNECKETVWSLGEELDAMVRAWRQIRHTDTHMHTRDTHTHAAPHRLNEICFKSARWRLTDADGQLGIADLLLTNFMYTKTSRSDDSVEHQLELGYVQVTNLLPNEPFPEVLAPQTTSGRAPLGRRAALRVFCRDRPPVGGISVKEHFEVNIVPIRIGLTKKFFNTILKFCFPGRDPDTIEGMEGDDEEGGTLRPSTSGSKKIKKKNKDSNSNFYVKRDKKDKDDVEKMKERAEKNKLFIYIKIPEVPVRVSYKGSKEKNLEDVRDLPLVLPTLEYHNVTWTWLDLLLATKSDTRRVIVSQAIRQKLQLHRRAATAPEPLEEDKARLLLGERTVAENKPQKKGTPSVFKFSKS